MSVALAVVFVAVYLAIAFEEGLGVHKSASALVGAGVLWTIYALGGPAPELVQAQLRESLVGTAEVVFFLMGAMTIVEVVDAHDGFDLITSRVRTRQLTPLLWVVAWITFVLSAVLDNLTTTIIMVSLVRKLVREADLRLWFAGLIVIAANAGGVWSPIGDVTTTMLWVAGRISAEAVMTGLLFPAIVNLLLPLLVVSLQLRGRQVEPLPEPERGQGRPPGERRLMFVLGLGILLMVPAFKAITHLPPFLGVLFGLGVVWMVGELLHRKKEPEARQGLTLVNALSVIDMASLVFFVGILLSVATLEHAGLLHHLAELLARTVGDEGAIVTAIGLASAVIDNVPLVAAALGMYDPITHPIDSPLWRFLAYCAGTGGSILIIGSAAGVAAMGLERIEFVAYARRFSGLATLGYFGGIAAYLLQHGPWGG